MKLYLVGQVTINCGTKGFVARGIFNSKEKAIAICIDENHFWAEVELNQDLGLENKDFEVFDYPIKSISREFLYNNPNDVIGAKVVHFGHYYNCIAVDVQEGLMQLQNTIDNERTFWVRCESCRLHKFKDLNA